jgi:hypothetical protein
MLTARGYKNGGVVSLLCPINTEPQFLSQPLALLIFNDFLTFRRAAQELREDRGIIIYGPPTIAGADTSLAQVLEDWRKLIPPTGAAGVKHYLQSVLPERPSSQWDNGVLKRKGGAFARSVNNIDAPDPLSEALYAELGSLKPDARTVETTTFTQQVDPAFMEPETGLAYLSAGLLTLVAGTHSETSRISTLFLESTQRHLRRAM